MNRNIQAENAAASRELHDMLLLRYEPIAVKMIEDLADVPENAVNPKRDMGKHMCLCQAYALTRRNKKTIFMDKDSEWCWCPLVCMGYVESAPGTKPFEFLTGFIGIGDKDARRTSFPVFRGCPTGSTRGLSPRRWTRAALSRTLCSFTPIPPRRAS
jgi:uncharacterized protein (DUF169 family)